MLDPVNSPASPSTAQAAIANPALSPGDDSASTTSALKALGVPAAPAGPSFASTLQSRLRLTALNKLAAPVKARAEDIGTADPTFSADRLSLIADALSLVGDGAKTGNKTVSNLDATTESASGQSNTTATQPTDTPSATPIFTLTTAPSSAGTTITPIVTNAIKDPAISTPPSNPPVSVNDSVRDEATAINAGGDAAAPTPPATIAATAEIKGPVAAIADKQREGSWFGELLGNRVNVAPLSAPLVSNAAMPARIVATPVSSSDWSGDVGNQLTWMVSQRESSANLVLNPPDMGRIEISITMNGDQASASFISTNPDVRDALQGSLPRLREVLADAGVFLGQADIGAQAFGQQQNGAEKGRKSGHDSLPAGGQSLLGSVNLPSTMSILTSGQGLIDLFA